MNLNPKLALVQISLFMCFASIPYLYVNIYSLVFCIVEQVLLVLGASGMVWVTTSYREQKKGLPLLHQVTNWSLAVVAILLPLKSPHEILARLNSIFLGFAPLFLLLSIGYVIYQFGL